MIMGKGMLLAMTLVLGGTAAMMGGMMASGVMGPGMMPGWGGSSTSAPQTPVVSQSEEFTVEIRGFAFRPNDLTVTAGSEVAWLNRDGAPHDATEDGGAWETKRLFKGDRDTLTLDEPGVYSYHCSIHPEMRATLRVQ